MNKFVLLFAVLCLCLLFFSKKHKKIPDYVVFSEQGRGWVLAKQLAERGHEVHVYCRESKMADSSFLFAEPDVATWKENFGTFAPAALALPLTWNTSAFAWFVWYTWNQMQVVSHSLVRKPKKQLWSKRIQPYWSPLVQVFYNAAPTRLLIQDEHLQYVEINGHDVVEAKHKFIFCSMPLFPQLRTVRCGIQLRVCLQSHRDVHRDLPNMEFQAWARYQEQVRYHLVLRKKDDVFELVLWDQIPGEDVVVLTHGLRILMQFFKHFNLSLVRDRRWHGFYLTCPQFPIHEWTQLSDQELASKLVAPLLVRSESSLGLYRSSVDSNLCLKDLTNCMLVNESIFASLGNTNAETLQYLTEMVFFS